jgi:hypothetical protein
LSPSPLHMSAITQGLAAISLSTAKPEPTAALIAARLQRLQEWIEIRDYAGHEPYDILNSPRLASRWIHQSLASIVFVQVGRRWGGTRMRRWLRVPPSKNPKALALMLASYCDRMRAGESCSKQARYMKSELRRLRSPREEAFCWGYDWDVRHFRNTNLPAFSPHAIATVFGGQALLDLAEVTGDEEAAEMALSAGRFIVSRLNRTVDTALDLCFSYTPLDRGRVYNSSALVAAFLARLEAHLGFVGGCELARRVMHYLASEQAKDGSWFYGAGRMQKWIDNFHTGYNLVALLEYQQITADNFFDDTIHRGYEFYCKHFFDPDGAPRYFNNSRFPVDIHCCSQAILTFCAFAQRDASALQRALDVANWTLDHMLGSDGAFYYQRHRFWLNRSTYMRWGQAWMHRALTRLHRCLTIAESTSAPGQFHRLATTGA